MTITMYDMTEQDWEALAEAIEEISSLPTHVLEELLCEQEGLFQELSKIEEILYGDE